MRRATSGDAFNAVMNSTGGCIVPFMRQLCKYLIER